MFIYAKVWCECGFSYCKFVPLITKNYVFQAHSSLTVDGRETHLWSTENHLINVAGNHPWFHRNQLTQHRKLWCVSWHFFKHFFGLIRLINCSVTHCIEGLSCRLVNYVSKILALFYFLMAIFCEKYHRIVINNKAMENQLSRSTMYVLLLTADEP